MGSLPGHVMVSSLTCALSLRVTRIRTNADRMNSSSCLIADVRMPGMTGLELHDRLVETGRSIPTILMTAHPNGRDRERALQAGVFCYLTKPYSQDELLACIRSALEPPRGDRRACCRCEHDASSGGPCPHCGRGTHPGDHPKIAD